MIISNQPASADFNVVVYSLEANVVPLCMHFDEGRNAEENSHPFIHHSD
jgi:hypothetical protein